MKIGHMSSSESALCVKCGKKTSTFKTYTQTNIEVRVPVCDNYSKVLRCYYEIDISDITDIAIKLIKREIAR